MGVIYELYGIPVYDNDIYHSGIKGMHWGIRRYQNPDGTLTPEGRKRYNVGSDGNLYDKETGKKYGLSTKAKVGIGAGAAALAGGAALAADQIFNGGRGRQAIGQFVGNTAQKVGNWAGDRAQDVSDWWTGENDHTRALRKAAGNAMENANSLANSGQRAAASELGARANNWTKIANDISSNGMSDKISNAAQNVWNGAQNTAQNVGNWVSDRAQDVSDWWTGDNDVSRAYRNSSNNFMNQANAINVNPENMSEATAARNALVNRANAASDLANRYQQTGVGDRIANAAQNAWNGVRGTAQNAWNGVQNTAQNVGNWVSDRAQDVSDWWTGDNDLVRRYQGQAENLRNTGAQLSGQAGNVQDAQSIYDTYMNRADRISNMADKFNTGGARGAIADAAQNVGDWFGDRAQDASNWWNGTTQRGNLMNQANEQWDNARAAQRAGYGLTVAGNNLGDAAANRSVYNPNVDYNAARSASQDMINRGQELMNNAKQGRINANELRSQARNFVSPQDRFNSAVGSVKNFFGLGAEDIGKTVRLDNGKVGKFMGWVQLPNGTVFPNIVE